MTLANAAATRLNGLSGNQLGGSVPNNIGEITHGVLYGIAPNTLTPKQICKFYGRKKEKILP